MTPTPDLITLLDRASEGSRELDFELHISLIEDAIWPATDRRGRVTNPHSRMSDYLAAYRDVINADDQDFDFPRYSTSLDAALALVERKLPGWFGAIIQNRWSMGEAPKGREWTAELAPPHPGMDGTEAYGPTAPLALCTALLKALTHQPGDGHGG